MSTNAEEVTGRVYRFHEPGGTTQLKLAHESVAAPRPGEVRIRVQSLGLNRADILFLADTYVDKPELPSKLGYEVGGVVDAVGTGVEGFRPGQRVSSIPTFSIRDYGAFADYANIPARGLMETPENLSVIEASAFALAYFTGYFSIFEQARLTSFQTILITAASSTTGIAAIAMAKACNATTIVTTRSSTKAAGLKAAGADHVIATAEEDLVKRVLEISNGLGVDVIYDCVAGRLSESLIACIRPTGHWIVYGLMDLDPVPFPWFPAVIKAVNIHLYSVFNFTGHRHLHYPADEAALERGTKYIRGGMAANGPLSITIDKVYKGLEALPEAMEHMNSSAGTGKIVVQL